MKLSDYLYIFSTLTAVFSIFLSNYLGQQSVKQKQHDNMLLERYRLFYVPIMSKIYRYNPEILTKEGDLGNVAFTEYVEEPVPEDFQDIAGKTRTVQKNWVHEFIKKNLQYATPELIKIYYSSFALKRQSPEYDHSLHRPSEEFNEKYKEFEKAKYDNNKLLILQILKEAQKISEETGLPNLAKPLLDVFQSSSYL